MEYSDYIESRDQANLPLDGTEIVAGSQGGSAKKWTNEQAAALALQTIQQVADQGDEYTLIIFKGNPSGGTAMAIQSNADDDPEGYSFLAAQRLDATDHVVTIGTIEGSNIFTIDFQRISGNISALITDTASRGLETHSAYPIGGLGDNNYVTKGQVNSLLSAFLLEADVDTINELNQILSDANLHPVVVDVVNTSEYVITTSHNGHIIVLTHATSTDLIFDNVIHDADFTCKVYVVEGAGQVNVSVQDQSPDLLFLELSGQTYLKEKQFAQFFYRADIDTMIGIMPETESGKYTPTLTNVANLDASTNYECQFFRVGNTVHVSGKLDIDPTLTATSTQLGISLPIASDFGAQEDCAGTAFASGIAGQGAAILADVSNNRAQLQYVSGDVSNQSMYFSFTYEIIE